MNDPIAVVHKESHDQNKVPHTLHQKIISVAELLSVASLTIPEYQRPYKWDKSNLASLFNDIKTQSDKPAYRLGTIVLHRSENDEGNAVLNIVDGQQRTLTLMLTVLAINTLYKNNYSEDVKPAHKVLEHLIKKVEAFSKEQEFKSDISQWNLHTNFQEITRIISRGDFTPVHIDFLLNRCEVVVFILDDASEAFQFFDSQNSRGKDLYPHDLLKAFHLREFNTDNEKLKATTVAYWENLDDNELASLFSMHLYRIRQWSKGKSAQTFSKQDVSEFKGISLDKKDLPPYAKNLVITHHYIDDYNASVHRNIAGETMPFPFGLDQTIINGKHFFEMVAHYHRFIKDIKKVVTHNSSYTGVKENLCTAMTSQQNNCCSVILYDRILDSRASAIIHTLNTYEKRNRDGDQYTHNLFNNSIIYYIDKFGTQYLSQAVELLFIRAYKVRLQQYAVKLTTLDNHAKNKGIFRLIREATLAKEVTNQGASTLHTEDVKDYNHRSKDSVRDLIEANELYKLYGWLNYVD